MPVSSKAQDYGLNIFILLFVTQSDWIGNYIPDENPMRPPVLSESEPQAMDEVSIRCEPNGARVCF